jgi:DNA repair photolyase
MGNDAVKPVFVGALVDAYPPAEATFGVTRMIL